MVVVLFQLAGWEHDMASKFEKSKKDVEKKSMGKEGSKREETADKRQMPKMVVIVAKPYKKK